MDTRNLALPRVKYAGVPVNLGGEMYIIPPLPQSAMRFVHELLAQHEAPIDTDLLDTIELCEDIALCGLQCNYPAITAAEMEDLIDPSNFRQVFACLMDHSGALRKQHQQIGDRAFAPYLTPGA